MLQFQHLLVTSKTALMSRHQLPLLPDLNVGRKQSRLHLYPRLHRRRVPVRAHLDAALAIYLREANLRQLEAFPRQRQQMLALDFHRLAYLHRLACDTPLLVLLAALQQQCVQLRQVLHPRNRHQVVAPEITHFAFDPTLLVAPRRVAEVGLKAPVRTKCYQPLRLFPLVTAQDLLHRALQVVVAQQPEDPTKVAKRQLMGFQKCLLRGVVISHMKRAAAGHRSHREAIHLAHLPANLGHRLVPIHLRFHTPVVDLGNESLPPHLPQFLFATPHVWAPQLLRYTYRATSFPSRMLGTAASIWSAAKLFSS